MNEIPADDDRSAADAADRGRAALLAAVSHDLRTPLAAAKALARRLRQRERSVIPTFRPACRR